MGGEKIKFWNSIVSRFALFFTGLIIMAILIAGYLVYQQAAEVITTHSQDRMKYTSNLASQTFYSLLNEVANDIALTSSNPLLNNFINAPSAAHLKDLQDLFGVTLENKAQYFQIRLLDVNNQGREIVRYDKVGHKIIRTPEDKLQFKGDRKYYREALTTPKGSFYYSDINLNEEFGAVSHPLTPTLRAVGQVYDQQQKLVAMLVINVDLSPFYEELRQITESATQLMLISEEGHYLFAEDMDKCFAPQLDHSSSFQGDFGIKVGELNPESFDYQFIKDQQDRSFLYHLVPLPYPRGQQIYLVTLLEDDLLFRSAHLVRNDSLKVVVVICLLAMVVVFLFTRISSRQINKITQAISAYEEGENKGRNFQLPESRNDEIGLLAHSFARMRGRIDQQLKDLKAAVGREQQAIQERDEFLQNMSHEIRTPLNAIMGLTQLLHKNHPSPEQQPIIDSLHRSAKNLTGLMYDILDHNKLKEGKVQIKFSPQNYYDLLSDIHGVYQYEALNKGLTFDLSIDESLRSKRFLTDPLRFNQIVTNLVVNAIKYTDKGTIVLRARPLETQSDAPGPMLEVRVSDSGRGISGKNLKKIRERFYRENEMTLTRAEGFGLGLSIVIQLVDLFGGKLEASSHKGQGSEFKVQLPLVETKAGSDQSPLQDGEIMLPSMSGHYHILHLEDDPAAQLLVSHILSMDCITLHQASRLEEARKIIRSHKPDLILSDLMLGNELIHSQLAGIMKKNQETPVILLSAFENPEIAGVNTFFLQKPFDIECLMDLVMVILGQSEYDKPHLEGSYDQYDRDPAKIRNFLSIVLSEFKAYLARIEGVFITRDQKEWEAIMHKLTTHIKNFKLKKLSGDLPEHLQQLDEPKLELIRNHLLYCLCVFRTESRLNSADGSYSEDLSHSWR